jgi:hypothetical protein
VRPAFRRFRRRLLLWAALILLAAVWLVVVYPLFVRDLPDQFAYGRSRAAPALVEYEHVEVIVLDAQPLGWYACNVTDCYGLHLLLIPRDLADHERLDVVLPLQSPGGARVEGVEPGAPQLLEVWLTARAGNPRVPSEVISVTGGDLPPQQQTPPRPRGRRRRAPDDDA